jgi:hypothetical protein
LVVHRIEGRYQIESFDFGFLVETTQIRNYEFHIAQFLVSRFLPSDENRFA